MATRPPNRRNEGRARPDEQLRLMTKVARPYHEHDVRQPEIARPLPISQADSVPEHILVLYENSSRGAAAMQQAAEAAARANASLTVVVVAVTEREDAGCCDTRAGYWNGVVRDLASADLQRARSLLGDGTTAAFKVVAGRSVLAALALETGRSRADMVVVPSGRGVHPWFRSRRARRLQRRATGSVVVASGVGPTAL